MEDLDHPNIYCVFDTGNRIAFDHDIYSDIVLLGDYIKHVHIKDKNENDKNGLLASYDHLSDYYQFKSLVGKKK